jgi:hypothetical protein
VVSEIDAVEVEPRQIDGDAEGGDDVPDAEEPDLRFFHLAVDLHAVVADGVREVQCERGATAEPEDVDVAITRRELFCQVAARVLDATVAADAECAADEFSQRAVFGTDAFIEEPGAGVEVLEPHYIGVEVVTPRILFRVPGPVERI